MLTVLLSNWLITIFYIKLDKLFHLLEVNSISIDLCKKKQIEHRSHDRRTKMKCSNTLYIYFHIVIIRNYDKSIVLFNQNINTLLRGTRKVFTRSCESDRKTVNETIGAFETDKLGAEGPVILNEMLWWRIYFKQRGDFLNGVESLKPNLCTSLWVAR